MTLSTSESPETEKIEQIITHLKKSHYINFIEITLTGNEKLEINIPESGTFVDTLIFIQETIDEFLLSEFDPVDLDYQITINNSINSEPLNKIRSIRQGTLINETGKLKNCVFQKEFSIVSFQDSSLHLTVINCTFIKKFRILGSSLGSLNINNCTFKEDFTLCESTINLPTYFYNNTTQKKSLLLSLKFMGIADFSNSKFNEIELKNSTFNEKVTFHNKTTFNGNSHFKNVTFKKLADFHQSVFNGPVKFEKTDFYQVAIFSEVHFKSSVMFIYNKVESNTSINFIKTIFNQVIDISHANFDCTLNFWKAKFVNDKNQEKYTLEDHEWEKYIQSDENKSEIIAAIKESFRLIKHSFRQVNNYTEANKYNLYELENYKLELAENKNNHRKDSFILWLNHLVSTHSTDPYKALFWFFVVAAVCYVPLLACSNLVWAPSWDGVAFVLQYFLHFINLTDWRIQDWEIMSPENPRIFQFLQYLCLLLFRILGAVIFYQIIKSFRKFSGN